MSGPTPPNLGDPRPGLPVQAQRFGPGLVAPGNERGAYARSAGCGAPVPNGSTRDVEARRNADARPRGPPRPRSPRPRPLPWRERRGRGRSHVAVRRPGRSAGAAGRGSDGSARAFAALAPRLLPEARARRPARDPSRRSRPRRWFVLGPPRACSPGRRGHLLDGRVVPRARRERGVRRRSDARRGRPVDARCSSVAVSRRGSGTDTNASAMVRFAIPILSGCARRRRCPTIR